MGIKMMVRSHWPTDKLREEEEDNWTEAGRGREDEQKKVAGGRAEGRKEVAESCWGQGTRGVSPNP